MSTGMGWPYSPSLHDTGLLIEDVYPCLFFGIEAVNEIERKSATLDWAGAAVETMLAEARRVCVEPPQLPVGITSWRHSFYSPVTGGPLLHDPTAPEAHYDPLTGIHHAGAERLGAWRQLTHERTYRLMRSLAVLYRLSGDEMLAEWVATGLRDSVRMFTSAAVRSHRWGSAVYNQPLYDAQILTLVANIYGLVRESPALTATDHEAIVERILRDQLTHQQQALACFDKVHNTTAYIALALASIGEVLGDEQLVEFGLNDPDTGLCAHLEAGLRTDSQGEVDGFWYEGSTFYHYYTLFALIGLQEMSRRRGEDVPEQRHRLDLMLSAPLRLCDERWRHYCLGDFGAPRDFKVPTYRHLYEYAAGQVDGQRYGDLLTRIYAAGPVRASLAALAYGPDELPTPCTVSEGDGRDLPAADQLSALGVAVLRDCDARGAYQVWLKCARYGGGHDHLDALALGLHACGDAMATDLGSPGYALFQARRYYKSTLSHNALMVDEQPQNPVSQVDLVIGEEPCPWARGRVEDAYPGVVLQRDVWLRAPVVQVRDRGCAEEEHRWGWVFHASGSMSFSISRECAPIIMEPLPDDDDLFTYFTHRTTLYTDGVLRVDWRPAEEVWLRLLLTADAPMECVLGRSPGNPATDDQGMVYARTRGRHVQFRAAFEVHNGWPRGAALPDADSDSGTA